MYWEHAFFTTRIHGALLVQCLSSRIRPRLWIWPEVTRKHEAGQAHVSSVDGYGLAFPGFPNSSLPQLESAGPFRQLTAPLLPTHFLPWQRAQAGFALLPWTKSIDQSAKALPFTSNWRTEGLDGQERSRGVLRVDVERCWQVVVDPRRWRGRTLNPGRGGGSPQC